MPKINIYPPSLNPDDEPTDRIEVGSQDAGGRRCFLDLGDDRQ